MARRTKEEALATRHALLDAAELLFQERGVSRTSLNDIARRAGVTRGAIYWHFKDKADLFNAMMERVTLPLEASFQQMGREGGPDPIGAIRQAIIEALRKTATDPQTRRVFEVATHKVEYVDELQAVRQRHLKIRNDAVTQLEQGLRQAARRAAVTLNIPAPEAAHGLHAMIDGLIQNWLLDAAAFDLVPTGRRVIDAYLCGLGLEVHEEPEGGFDALPEPGAEQ